MKIALITDGISPYVLGGMQRHSFYLAKYLAQKKIEVDLFHFNQSDLNIEKLDVFSDEEKKYINSIVIPFPKTKFFPGHYIYESYLYSKKVFEIIKPNLNQYDFIYTKGFAGWELLNQKHKREINCAPIGTNFHGYEMYQPAPTVKTTLELWLLKFYVASLLKKSDRVFSYGGKITSLLTDIAKVPFEKIIEVSSGIEKHWLLEGTKKQNRIVRFIFLGRAERRKGIEELNQALNAIKKKENFQFTFAGPIPDELKIQHKNILYTGEVREIEKLKQILREHDVLVCPSHSEGMPNVILEAMASALAIVATDVGAVNLMVNEKNGWLLHQVDVDLLVSTLQQICSIDKQELQNKQNQSIQIVKETFLFDKIIEQLLDKIVSAK